MRISAVVAAAAVLAVFPPAVFAQAAPTTSGGPDPSSTPAAPTAPADAPQATVSLEDFQALQKQVYDLKNKTNPVTPGYGKLTINGDGQIWIGGFTHPDTQYYKLNGFAGKIRRFELALNGVIDPRFSYHGMADFSRGASTQPGTIGILQDMFLQYSVGEGMDVLVGQTKLPLSEVGLQPSIHLMTIERPLFAVGARNTRLGGVTAFNNPQWADVRDLGVQFRMTRPQYTAQLAVTEGAGDYQNLVDTKYGKQVTAQFFWRPLGTPELQIGATGSTGSGFQAQLPKPAAGPQPGSVLLMRNRGGGSIIWKRDRVYLESEYLGGMDGVGIKTATNQAVSVGRHGEYALAGYDLGGYSKGDGNQVVAMQDYWFPGAGIPNQTNTTIGLNHDMNAGHERIQLNYTHQHLSGGVPAPADHDIDGLVASFGVSW